MGTDFFQGPPISLSFRDAAQTTNPEISRETLAPHPAPVEGCFVHCTQSCLHIFVSPS